VAAVNYEDSDAGLCYLVQELDLQGPGSSWIVLEGGDGWRGWRTERTDDEEEGEVWWDNAV
jgi:hypothetical protein